MGLLGPNGARCWFDHGVDFTQFGSGFFKLLGYYGLSSLHADTLSNSLFASRNLHLPWSDGRAK